MQSVFGEGRVGGGGGWLGTIQSDIHPSICDCPPAWPCCPPGDPRVTPAATGPLDSRKGVDGEREGGGVGWGGGWGGVAIEAGGGEEREERGGVT